MAGGGATVEKSGREHLHEGRITPYVVMVALIAASGGLMFGYDNGVSGGVSNNNHFLQKFYPEVLASKEADSSANSAYCKFDSQKLSTFTSVLFLAGLLAAFPAGWVTAHKGRKVSMVLAGAFYMVGTLVLVFAYHEAMLYIGRVLLGVGVGFAIQCTTLYNSEMAPAKIRGALNILFQWMVTWGILIAQLVNYAVEHNNLWWGWRLSLGIAFVPALILFLGGLLLPETPNSLVERGHHEEARRVLAKIRGTQNIDVEYDDIVLAVEAKNSVKANPWVTLMKPQYRPQLIITVLMPFFQQFTGINAVIFYSPILFASLGSGDKGSLEATLIIGAVNVAATLVAVFGVDRLGRRFLLLEAGFQCTIAEIIVAALLGHYFANSPKLPNKISIVVIVMICIFIASFAWSWGPLGWLVPSEIHPLETRSAGQGLNVTVNLLFTFLIAQSFVAMLCAMEYGVFIFFACWIIIATLFVYFFLPETKGLLIEDVHEVFAAHWFWKRTGVVAHVKDIEGRPSMVNGVDVLRASMVRSSMSQPSMTMGDPEKGGPKVAKEPAIAPVQEA